MGSVNRDLVELKRLIRAGSNPEKIEKQLDGLLARACAEAVDQFRRRAAAAASVHNEAAGDAVYYLHPDADSDEE